MVTTDAPTTFSCRSCGAALTEIVLDLGEQPLANSYLKPGTEASEQRFPLCARLCTACGLVQVGDFVAPEDIFSDYAYFSSYSDSWVEHGRRFATAVEQRFGLTAEHTVVELASNDGYLLQHFRDDGIGVLGVEPAANVAEVAVANGIPTVVEFFGRAAADELVASGHQADLLVANNVFAHVPDLNDFVAGMERILSPVGVVSIEVPHLLRMIEFTQFDTIYHEHFSYVSLLAATAVLERHGLRVFDVEEIPTHGGSLRIFASRASGPDRPVEASVQAVLDAELAAHLDRPEGFHGFAARATACIEGLAAHLDEAAASGRRVAAYGAAAKGNTLLNAAGIGPDRIAYVVDRSIHKQDLLLPGSHLPIRDPAFLLEDRPDEVLILPWNLRDEIVGQMAEVRSWGGRFVTAVPQIQVVS